MTDIQKQSAAKYLAAIAVRKHLRAPTEEAYTPLRNYNGPKVAKVGRPTKRSMPSLSEMRIARPLPGNYW